MEALVNQAAPAELSARRARLKMVEEQVILRGIRDTRILNAMRHVPRHIFIDEALSAQAYSDNALPIGYGQTISQPFMVAFMIEALEIKDKDVVLEIGTGSGYQTAILAELTDRVYSVERILPLLERARKTLDVLRVRNVMTRLGDGASGWKEYAPFNAIIMAAASPSIPPILIDQLVVGGTMVVPVGKGDNQNLRRMRKTSSGISEEILGNCRFVPFVSGSL